MNVKTTDSCAQSCSLDIKYLGVSGKNVRRTIDVKENARERAMSKRVVDGEWILWLLLIPGQRTQTFEPVLLNSTSFMLYELCIAVIDIYIFFILW